MNEWKGSGTEDKWGPDVGFPRRDGFHESSGALPGGQAQCAVGFQSVKAPVPSLARTRNGSDRLVKVKQMLSSSSCGVPWGGLPAVLGRAGQSLASLPSEGPLCQSLPTRLHPTIRQGWQW